MDNTTQQAAQWLTLATVKEGVLTTSQRFYFEEMLREEMAEYYDREYGSGNWLITPTANLPEGFDPAIYTIENGLLVPASAEVLAVRNQVETARKASMRRMERNDRLTETDRYMIPDFPLTAAQREQYRGYRAYLRDLPKSEWFPNVPVANFEEFIQSECD